MKIGVVGLSLGCLDFTKALDFIKEIGGSYIELCTVKGAHNNTLDLTEGNRNFIKEAILSRGLSIASVAGYTDFSLYNSNKIEKQVKELQWYCQLAVDLNANIVRILRVEQTADVAREELLKSLIVGFQSAVSMAKNYHVTLALENHGYLVNDASTLVKIIENVASENLKITLDTGNFCWAGHSLQDTYNYFKILAPYVVNVHLKDFIFTEKNKVKFVPLGEGLLNLNRVIEYLVLSGYKGTFLCEYEGLGDPKELLKLGTFSGEEIIREIKKGTEKSLRYISSILEKYDL